MEQENNQKKKKKKTKGLKKYKEIKKDQAKENI